MAIGEPCDGLGEAMKNFGLWYWVWNLLGTEDSDGPSSTFYMGFVGTSRFFIFWASDCCFGMAIVVSSLFSSAAFFSNSSRRSSSGYSCVLWKFSIFFSSSTVFSTSAASFLLICFSRNSSSLWSHLHRLWFCSCSNRSSLWLNYFTNWCLTS